MAGLALRLVPPGRRLPQCWGMKFAPVAGDIDEVHVWSQALPIYEIWKTWGWLLGQPNRQ